MSEKRIKVIDKRMFGADGKLREEYRDAQESSTGGAGIEDDRERQESSRSALEEAPAGAATPGQGAPESSSVVEAAGKAGEAAGPPPRASTLGSRGTSGAGGGSTDPGLEIPPTGAGAKPGFLDLVGAVADPIALYLGDARLPEGQSLENLDAARLYIDLLEVLREKTRGNLDARESAFLEDLLCRFRMRYVQKRG